MKKIILGLGLILFPLLIMAQAKNSSFERGYPGKIESGITSVIGEDNLIDAQFGLYFVFHIAFNIATSYTS